MNRLFFLKVGFLALSVAVTSCSIKEAGQTVAEASGHVAETVTNGIACLNGSSDGSASDGAALERVRYNVSSDFNAIVVDDMIDVEFTQSDCTDEFEIYGVMDKKWRDLVTVEVKGNTLHLRMARSDRKTNDGYDACATVYVTARMLKEVTLNGVGDFEVTNALKAPLGLSVTSSGTGDFNVKDVDAADTTVTLQVRGTGDIGIGSVKARNVTASVLGTGDIEIGSVRGSLLKTSVSGTGDVECRNIEVTECVADVKGTGDIELSGRATEVRYTVEGNGQISATKLRADKGVASVPGVGEIECNVRSLQSHTAGLGSISNMSENDD